MVWSNNSLQIKLDSPTATGVQIHEDHHPVLNPATVTAGCSWPMEDPQHLQLHWSTFSANHQGNIAIFNRLWNARFLETLSFLYRTMAIEFLGQIDSHRLPKNNVLIQLIKVRCFQDVSRIRHKQRLLNTSIFLIFSIPVTGFSTQKWCRHGQRLERHRVQIPVMDWWDNLDTWITILIMKSPAQLLSKRENGQPRVIPEWIAKSEDSALWIWFRQVAN